MMMVDKWTKRRKNLGRLEVEMRTLFCNGGSFLRRLKHLMSCGFPKRAKNHLLTNKHCDMEEDV